MEKIETNEIARSCAILSEVIDPKTLPRFGDIIFFVMFSTQNRRTEINIRQFFNVDFVSRSNL